MRLAKKCKEYTNHHRSQVDSSSRDLELPVHLPGLSPSLSSASSSSNLARSLSRARACSVGEVCRVTWCSNRLRLPRPKLDGVRLYGRSIRLGDVVGMFGDHIPLRVLPRSHFFPVSSLHIYLHLSINLPTSTSSDSFPSAG